MGEGNEEGLGRGRRVRGERSQNEWQWERGNGRRRGSDKNI